ncbi:MAG: metal ABC transporter ATP-binding protein [Treponemataceae bacterium]
MKALITCKDVSIGYDNTAILHDVNFFVPEKSFLSIIGGNGAGKTTLLQTLLQLKPALAGTIFFDKDCKKTEIGYVPQKFIHQNNFPASVWEVMLSGRLNQHFFSPFFSKEDKTIAEQNLERLKIHPLKNKSYQELSVGQQQKVLLARALCATKKLIFLDEPISSLDPTAKNELYEIILQLNKEQNITIVMISHDIESVQKYSTHILEIKNHRAFFSAINDETRNEA